MKVIWKIERIGYVRIQTVCHSKQMKVVLGWLLLLLCKLLG